MIIEKDVPRSYSIIIFIGQIDYSELIEKRCTILKRSSAFKRRMRRNMVCIIARTIAFFNSTPHAANSHVQQMQTMPELWHAPIKESSPMHASSLCSRKHTNGSLNTRGETLPLQPLQPWRIRGTCQEWQFRSQCAHTVAHIAFLSTKIDLWNAAFRACRRMRYQIGAALR